MTRFRQFGAITKIEDQDDGSIKVWGVASSETRDQQGETITAAAMKAALPDYGRFPALREMHEPSAAGRVVEAEVDDHGITQIRGDLAVLKSTIQGAADGMTSGFAGMRGAVEQSARSVDGLTASIHAMKPQELVSGLHEVTTALKQNSSALQDMAAKSGEGKLKEAFDFVSLGVDVIKKALPGTRSRPRRWPSKRP